MEYLVKAWKMKGDSRDTSFWEFETKEEAEEFADWKAKQLRKYGYEFDVRIYELVG